MKTLLLARHAKSDWDDPTLRDHDRPLNARGERDAPVMARRLLADGIRTDRIVTSSATRARSTAAAHGAVHEVAPVQEPRLYAASARTILQVASALPDDADVAMLVGHNPGMSDAVDELTGDLVSLPTCAVAVCAFDVDSWAELVEGSGRLLRVLSPRDEG